MNANERIINELQRQRSLFLCQREALKTALLRVYLRGVDDGDERVVFHAANTYHRRAKWPDPAAQAWLESSAQALQYHEEEQREHQEELDRQRDEIRAWLSTPEGQAWKAKRDGGKK